MLYFDNCRTSFVPKEVYDEVIKYMTKEFYIPASFVSKGTSIAEDIENAAEYIGKTINAKSTEILFTHSGTEANNIAMQGLAKFIKNKDGRNHIIIGSAEHPAIMSISKILEKEGFKISTVNVDKEGFLDLNHLKSLINDKTFLVATTYVNHMAGCIQPSKQISEILQNHKYKIYLFLDAAEAYGKLKIDVKDLGCDLLSASGHKFHGPKGVGFLYIKSGTKLEKIYGGSDYYSDLCPGGPNIPGIMGMKKAAELAYTDFDKNYNKVKELSQYLYDRITKEIPAVILNGPWSEGKRSPYHVNFTFEYVEGEAIMMFLDFSGITVSTASACASKNLQSDYALKAMGRNHVESHGAIRFTLSRFNEKKDIDNLMEVLPEIIQKLRDQSTLTPESLRSK